MSIEYEHPEEAWRAQMLGLEVRCGTCERYLNGCDKEILSRPPVCEEYVCVFNRQTVPPP